MLAHVQQTASPRRLRLFACACCRLATHVPGSDIDRWEEQGHPLVTNAQRWAQNWGHPACSERLVATTQAALLRDIFGNPFRPVVFERCCRCDGAGEAQGADRPFEWSGPGTYPGPCLVCGRRGTILPPWLTPTVLSLAQAAYEERGRKCEACKGTGSVPNGSDEMTCGHCHGTGTVDTGTLDPDCLAVLADALEEAGCTEESLLRHLRGQEPVIKEVPRMTQTIAPTLYRHAGWKPLRGPHVRGCWALDLILGRE